MSTEWFLCFTMSLILSWHSYLQVLRFCRATEYARPRCKRTNVASVLTENCPAFAYKWGHLPTHCTEFTCNIQDNTNIM